MWDPPIILPFKGSGQRAVEVGRSNPLFVRGALNGPQLQHVTPQRVSTYVLHSLAGNSATDQPTHPLDMAITSKWR